MVVGCSGAQTASGPTATRRDRGPSSFLRFRDRQRPHSAAGGRPPVTRVPQDRKQGN
jgi:hypothetical protein